jgi:hypothetical protein
MHFRTAFTRPAAAYSPRSRSRRLGESKWRRSPLTSDEVKRIDASLREWRQGDLALEESWFVPAAGRFTSVEGQIVTLQEMTAEDYVDSDPLDLDHLSTTGGE